jgi:hypothetical protein
MPQRVSLTPADYGSAAAMPVNSSSTIPEAWCASGRTGFHGRICCRPGCAACRPGRRCGAGASSGRAVKAPCCVDVQGGPRCADERSVGCVLPELAGYNVDARPTYSLRDVNSSAAAWSAGDATAEALLQRRHAEARRECDFLGGSRGQSRHWMNESVGRTGGFCLAPESAGFGRRLHLRYVQRYAA